MNKEFRLPDAGEGLTEADIVSWKVKPGDTVTVNQVLVDIETAKAVVELPSPWDGVVSALLVEEGQTVDVGAPIISIDVAGGEGEQGAEGERSEAAAGTTPDAPNGSSAPPQRQPVLVGYGVKPGSTSRRPRKKDVTRPATYPRTPAAPPAVAPPAAPSGTAGGMPSGMAGAQTAPGDRPIPEISGLRQGGGRPLAKPPVRKLARDLGIDLATVTGTGPQGSVTKGDVERAAAGGAGAGATIRSASSGVAFPGEATRDEERIPVKGVRKHTATAMVGSAFTAPHVTEFLQADVTETMAAVRRVRELPEFAGVKVSPLLFVAKALLAAVARHPMINSSWDEAAQEIVVKHHVNLGIAVASDRGLLVPNVKSAQALPLAGLASALDSLAATARAGKATPADLSGGTITITNVGVFGVDAGTPILTPGEAAILAFGQIRDAPWVVSGELAVRKVTTLSLSFDHRVVDGELGSAVLRDVGSMLEDPVRMLAWT
ncbi:MAG: 2-oxo acid dehydrogenase subunit E2 [Nocardiopsaceae bacterium]|nr:2-oxo acid dehydrogenase subunit E2 [Nocardiopsaceae bacterium]